jgi:hypothetical protein
MTVKDNEFPLLTHQAECVLGQSIDISTPNWNRRFAAAVIREAMMQSGTWNINSDFPRVIDAKDLDAIADNLHALPPVLLDEGSGRMDFGMARLGGFPAPPQPAPAPSVEISDQAIAGVRAVVQGLAQSLNTGEVFIPPPQPTPRR